MIKNSNYNGLAQPKSIDTQPKILGLLIKLKPDLCFSSHQLAISKLEQELKKTKEAQLRPKEGRDYGRFVIMHDCYLHPASCLFRGTKFLEITKASYCLSVLMNV